MGAVIFKVCKVTQGLMGKKSLPESDVFLIGLRKGHVDIILYWVTSDACVAIYVCGSNDLILIKLGKGCGSRKDLRMRVVVGEVMGQGSKERMERSERRSERYSSG